jgi:hypothetical protein
MAKVKKLTATGDVENNVPIKVYEVIFTATAAGANVIIQDSTTELVRIYSPANTTQQFIFSHPLICKTECTLTIANGGGTAECAVIYDEWSL